MKSALILRFYVVPIGGWILGYVFRYDWMIDAALVLFLANGVYNVVSALRRPRRRWRSVAVSIVVLFGFYSVVLFFLTFAPPDFYGAHKRIPADIEIAEPLDTLPAPDSLSPGTLLLIHSIQPGIYYYATNIRPESDGEIYLKVFEVTSEDRLSEESIRQSTVQPVYADSNLAYAREFTIYEGSWGDKYGARIELWYRAAGDEQEQLIIQKNYIVEGWMR